VNLRIAIALVLCCLAFAATAQTTIGVHTVSIHAPDHDENNENFGLYVQHKRLILGAYRNSIDRNTVYAGYVQPLGHGFDVMAGLASGYEKRCHGYAVKTGEKIHIKYNKHGEISKTTVPVYETRESCSGFSRWALAPALAIGYTAPFSVMGAAPKLTLVPGFGSKSSTVGHLSFQWSIK